MPLRLLWVTPFLPARGVSGTHAYLWALLERHSRRHEVRLVSLVDADETASPGDLPPGLADVRLLRKTAAAEDDPLCLRPRAVGWGFTDPQLRAALAAELARDHHDLVRWDYAELANVLPPTRVPSLLTVHQLWFAAAGPEWRAAGRGVRRAPVALHRHLRDLDFELHAVRRADHVVALTREDGARLQRFLPDLPLTVVPAGIDLAHFRPPRTPLPVVADLLFVGHFKHYANVDAARFLVRDVLPRLGRAARVRLVGTAVPPEVRALAGGDVTVEAGVPDIREALASAAVVVAPVRFGTGMRVKVLEALAMGRPVVATSLGAEGLDAVAGTHLLVADAAADFAAAVRRLLDDPGAAAAVGAAGRALAEARFGWDTVADTYDAVYAAVAAAPRRAAAASAPVPGWAAWCARSGRLPGAAAGSALLALRGLRWYLGAPS